VLAVTIEDPQRQGGGGSPAGDVLTVAVWQTQKGERRTLATEVVGRRETQHLRLTATDRTRFQFAVSPDGRNWKSLAADAAGDYLPPWDLSVRVALLVSGPPAASARFGVFRLEGASR
jgi:hypothetical protein